MTDNVLNIFGFSKQYWNGKTNLGSMSNAGFDFFTSTSGFRKVLRHGWQLASCRSERPYACRLAWCDPGLLKFVTKSSTVLISCLYIWVMTTARWGLKVKVIGRDVKGQCKNVCATRVSIATYHGYWLMAVVVGFHCEAIRCEVARRDGWRGAVKASSSGAVQRVWAW